MPVYWAGWQRPWDSDFPPFDFELGFLTADDTTAVDWSSLKAEMQPAWLNAEAWDPVWANFVGQVGSTWGDYVAMLSDNAVYHGRLGYSLTDVNQLVGFELRQALGMNPLQYLVHTVDATSQTPGLPLSFDKAYAQPLSRRYELGPLGRGWTHNWEIYLEEEADGTVRITDRSGTPHLFQPDIRGGYFSPVGDQSMLTDLGEGAFSLREVNGLSTVFRTDGKLDYIEDTNGNRITAGYTTDQLTSLTHSSGATLLLAYSAGGTITSVTDPLGPGSDDDRVTTYSYDASGEHLVSAQRYSEPTVTTYAYLTGQGAAKEHALSQIGYPGGTHEYFTYDAAGRLLELYRDGEAEKVTFTYGSSGKVSATDAIGGTTDFFFDYRNLLLKLEDPLDNPVHWTYDNESNLVQLTGATGLSYAYQYDDRGNMTGSTDPLGNSTSFAYDGPYNRVTALVDANRNTTQFAYDAQGNQTSITHADFTREQFDYDATGNPTEWTNRRGNAIDYTYEAAGRVTSKVYADSSRADFTYDVGGNLLSAVDSAGTTSLEYDAYDRLTKITYPGSRFLQFTYDAAGRRASSVDQLGHRLNYQYDTVGRLQRITDTGSAQVVQYTYDAAGRIQRKDLGNSVYTTYQYEAAGQLLHLTNYAPDDSVLSRFDYTYDALGRRTSMGTHYGAWTYEYDDIGQLTHAVLASTDPQIADQDLTYVYDALGNRIRTIVGGVTTEYTSNNMNQYTQVGDTTYVYDGDGNLIGESSPAGTKKYTYDDENRLVAVSSSDGEWSYEYDAFGNRVAATEDGQTTRYLIDPIGLGNAVSEYTGSGDLIAHYDHGSDLLSRVNAAETPAYYTFDAIGSTSQLTNLAGAAGNSYAYDPFGVSIGQSETLPNPFEFVAAFGVMNEGNGLEFMRARFYDPELGRFLGEDPLLQPFNTLNVHAYCDNEPLGKVDPSGLQCERQSREPVEKPWWSNFLGSPGTVIQTAEVVGETVNTLGDINNYADKYRNNPVLKEYYGPDYDPWPNLPKMAKRRYCAPTQEPKTPSANNTNSGGNGSSTNARPRDPNEKAGPSGYGESGYVGVGTLLSYRVDFENDATATAPAQRVEVTDQLSSNLDWTTFALTEIGFGDTMIDVPDGSQHFETTEAVTHNSKDFEVRIDAGINAATGEVRVVLQSVDPATELPPDVLTGFLPPEDGTGRGMGYFTYVVYPKSGLSTGTEVRNVALITFDFVETIATNQVDPHDPSKGTDPDLECLNTIDAGLPTSQVAALASQTSSSSVLVSWSGNDEGGDGSGIAGYDIYVSKDGAAYSLWLGRTAATSATFTGDGIHTYSFYSIAIDNAGNREAAPAAADAQTTLLEQAIKGTSGDDTFVFTAGPSYDTWVVTVNGAAQAIDSRASGVRFDGLGGNDTVSITGTAGIDTAVLHPTDATLSGTGYSVTAVNVETIGVDGLDGADVASLFDSAGDDTLVTGPDSIQFSGGARIR